MFLNARIRISNATATAVPEAAVVRYGNDEFVLEDTGNNTFHLLPVQTGMKEDGMVEITGKDSDLTGKTVIIKNAYAVLSQIKNAGEEE
jgi:cobalt-zinc-cadmium efflux system membrane fusion protein